MESDEALYERLVRGELLAFDRLYERLARPLFAYIRGELGDAAEAEDVLHEVFLAVLRERARRGEVRCLRAWLYQVARHQCLNRVRSRRRAARAHGSIAEVAELDGLLPSNDLEARQENARLDAAVARLSPALAETYRLRASGLSYEDVARALSVPVGTVKSRVHELVQRLHEELSR